MTRNGVDHPAILDLITEGDESIQLILVEERTLAVEDAPALQEKLYNYLAYALDGGLRSAYQQAATKPTVIRVDLYAQPHPFIVEFLHRYAGGLVGLGVALEANVNGKAIA